MADLQTEGFYRQNSGTFHEKTPGGMRMMSVGGKKPR